MFFEEKPNPVVLLGFGLLFIRPNLNLSWQVIWAKLKRCTTAYSNSCSQVYLEYLHPFRCNSLLKCVLQPKIVEKSLKPLFWGFKVINVESLEACLQLLLLQATSLCLSASARWANSSKIIDFSYAKHSECAQHLDWKLNMSWRQIQVLIRSCFHLEFHYPKCLTKGNHLDKIFQLFTNIFAVARLK